MLKKQVSPKLVALVFGIIVICFAIAFYVVAWEEPGSAPPEGNVPAPLNTSSEAQAKVGGLLLNTGGYPNGLIVDQGNVGIGTTEPSGILHVDTSSAIPNIYLSRDAMGYGDDFRLRVSGDGSKSSLIISTSASDTEGIIIRDDGNVGIGTTEPSQKLDVSGQIHATEDICTDVGGGACLSTGGGGGGAFGASVSKTMNTVYTADTSGILVVRAHIRARYEHNYVEIRSDDSTTPTIVVGHIGAYCTDNCNTTVYHTMSAPILKGKKYRVVQSGSYVTVDAIEFYPNN